MWIDRLWVNKRAGRNSLQSYLSSLRILTRNESPPTILSLELYTSAQLQTACDSLIRRDVRLVAKLHQSDASVCTSKRLVHIWKSRNRILHNSLLRTHYSNTTPHLSSRARSMALFSSFDETGTKFFYIHRSLPLLYSFDFFPYPFRFAQ